MNSFRRFFGKGEDVPVTHFGRRANSGTRTSPPLIAALALAVFSLEVGAGEIPPLVLPAGVGVNIHFVSGHERDLDLIRDAGFKFIRMDFGWTAIEREKGRYNWSEYDELLGNLDRRGLRAVFILDYSHPLYESVVTNQNPVTHEIHRTTASPQHAESVAAFARWAAAAAVHYRGRHVIWEIWNEPNITFWSPHPDAQQYATLALATAKAIREAAPDSTIVAPATSTFPWEFLEAVFKSGLLEYLDAVSVHPYREPHRPPETAAADYEKLRRLIEKYVPPGKAGKLPILSGEWGYSTWTRGVSLETQAAFAARQQLANVLHGVPLSIWYDWKNDGTDPKENEHNFGTVLPDFTPKPAYLAIRTLTHELSGCSIAQRLPLANTNDYVLVCTNSTGEQELAAWTLGAAHEISIAIEGASAPTVAAWDGKTTESAVQSGKLKLTLGPQPQYVRLGRGRVGGR